MNIYNSKTVKQKSISGIYIDTEHLHVVEVNRQGAIKQMAGVQIPKQALLYERPESINQLANVVAGIIESSSIKKKMCALCLSDKDIIIRDMVLPFMKHHQIIENVDYEIMEYLPLSREKYIVEYRVMNIYKENRKEMLSLMIAAVPRKLVQFYIEVMKNAGLNLRYIDVAVNCRVKLLNRMVGLKADKGMNGNVCFLSIETGNTQYTIFHQGKYFINKSIFDLDVEGKTAETLGERLINELYTIMEYCDNRISVSRLNRVYLMGKGALKKGLIQYLTRYADTKVSYIDEILIQLCKFKYNSISNTGGLFAHAIGATLREGR